MNDAENNPVYQALRGLITVGRLTGVTPSLALDGLPLLPPGDTGTQPPPTAWNPDGFSELGNEYGAQMCRGVEEFRSLLRKESDPVKQALAEELPQWFGRLNTTLSLTEFQQYQLRSNHANHFMRNAMIGLPVKSIQFFQEYGAPYKHNTTKEPVWFPTALQSGEITYTWAGSVKDVPNTRSCVQNWDADQVTAWARDWAEREWRSRTATPSGVDFSPAPPVSRKP